MQVHAYEPQTFILRQSPCADPEANFIYLLVGEEKALLIDTGAIADAAQMPLAQTVLELLPARGDSRLPLLVVHTHDHADHTAGDVQFSSLPGVQVVSAARDDAMSFFSLDNWPDGVGQVDLGGRVIDVLPAPGHHPEHIVFYDRRTALLLSGDFLLSGLLLIDDASAYRASAARIADFVSARPVAYILGGHVELDMEGQVTRGWHHRPDERPLQLDKADLLALPGALESFNGFYARHPNYILSHPVRNLMALLVVVGLAGTVLVLAIRFVWRRSRRRARA